MMLLAGLDTQLALAAIARICLLPAPPRPPLLAASPRTWKLVAVPGLEMAMVAGTGPIPSSRSAVAERMAWILGLHRGRGSGQRARPQPW